MRIVTDLIEADGIIDTREIEFLDELRKRYDIQKEDEVRAASLSLADALGVLSDAEDSLKLDLLGEFNQVAMSDDFCAREEALLILAIRNCLAVQRGTQVSVVSARMDNLNFENAQILYVESEWDEDVNAQIARQYRELCAEIRLAGFDFVYLPQIARHYQSIADEDILNIVSFLYPRVSQERLVAIVKQLQHLSTARFCKEQLAAKLHITALAQVPPSLMIKIGESMVDDQPTANFLLMEIEEEVLRSVRSMLDLFAKSYRNYRLNYLQEEQGRFVFKGFYKQIFDIMMLRRGVRSTVVIDTYRQRIYFPEADVVIDKIHRREKALYALVLLESASGGINFSKPSSAKQLQRYQHRMEAIQKKYRIIYRMFGGEESEAPNLESPAIRNPMLSLLKRQILKLGDILYHVDDYIIQRNFYGNYSVGLPPALCCCALGKDNEFAMLTEVEEWKRISAL